MNELRYTLVTEGTSDRLLIPILNWLLWECGVTCPIESTWADLTRSSNQSKRLQDQVAWALDLYPCDLLFVHRDADRESLSMRKQQMEEALQEIDSEMLLPPSACVVPVRELEAWLLFDEGAIRHAAGKSNGSTPLNLPKLHQIEGIADPKARLIEALRIASGFQGRRLKKIQESNAIYRILNFVEDLNPLRSLTAVNALEIQIKALVSEHAWDQISAV